MIQTILDTDALPVMEAFYTLQGEGFHQGKAAYFIRLAGCDVGCVWCDVKESWNAAKHPRITLQNIVSGAQEFKSKLIVITGGEPLMHNLDKLTQMLQHKGFETNIETSGSHPLSGTWNWICLSPKKFKAPLPAILPVANELKVVVCNKSDFKWAGQYAEKVSQKCKLYLQPEWDKREIITPLITSYIQENPQWQLSLQVHKYIGLP